MLSGYADCVRCGNRVPGSIPTRSPLRAVNPSQTSYLWSCPTGWTLVWGSSLGLLVWLNLGPCDLLWSLIQIRGSFLSLSGSRGTSSSECSQGSAAEDSRGASGEHCCGFRHILYSELLEKWVKGLCFHFNKHYLPLHQCADNQLRLIILGDDERMAEDGEIVAVEVDEGVEEIKYQPLKQCSLWVCWWRTRSWRNRIPAPKTMQFVPLDSKDTVKCPFGGWSYGAGIGKCVSCFCILALLRSFCIHMYWS